MKESEKITFIQEIVLTAGKEGSCLELPASV
nr:hypothetical protein NRS6131_03686 [Bacillus subtilis]